MKILHLILTTGGGGAERQLAGMAAEFVRRGHETHVAFVYAGTDSGRLGSSGCTLHHLGRGLRRRDPRVIGRLLALARRLRPDLIHTWLTHMDVAGGAAAKLLGIPWVMSERSAALYYPPTLLNRLRLAAGRRADRIVANSPGGAEYWREAGVPPARIEVVPNYVVPDEIDSAGALDDPRIGAGDELVLHVGRLSPDKNLPALIAAMAHVCRRRPSARLALCGEGPLRGTLEEQVRAAGLQEHVVFAGFVQNVASWLKRAAAVVTVSPCEGHPNAVLEALAAGAPLVVSDIPAHRAILGDDAALFVPANDARAIAAAIEETLENRRAALDRAARARSAVAALALDAVASRYEEIYREVLAG